MKKLAIKVLLLLTASVILFAGCREDMFIYPEEDYNNFIYVNSEPAGASIFHKGVYLDLTTPAWIKDLEPGRQYFTLKLIGFNDTTFAVTVEDSSNEYITVFLREE